jgi:nucleotide-binding universal stress UspA family protein
MDATGRDGGLGVVVAVDGSVRNRSAVAWAADNAAASGDDLVLVTVVRDRAPHLAKVPHQVQEEQADALLERVGDETASAVPAERRHRAVLRGHPATELCAAYPDARLLVVGKRGLGALPRLLVGSTSGAVAAQALVPVVVVPDTWHPEDHRQDAVVVGVDPYRPHDGALEAAFGEARRLGAPLVGAHGWEPPSMYAWEAEPEVTDDWQAAAYAAFESMLDAWRVKYPEVEAGSVQTVAHPAMAILDAAEKAQLVVLGRHRVRKMPGRALGSVTRAVLHYAECPVLVVPTGEEEA